MNLVTAVACNVTALVWWYFAWSAVPYALCERLRVTPAGTVGYMFLPFYNLYWIFANASRFGDAIDRMRDEMGLPQSTTKGNGLLAVGIWLAARVLATVRAAEVSAVVFAIACAWMFVFMRSAGTSLGLYFEVTVSRHSREGAP